MQKNIQELPVKAFEEIESIMQTEEAVNQSTTRKMADTYKKLRIQSRKKGNAQSMTMTSEQEADYSDKLT